MVTSLVLCVCVCVGVFVCAHVWRCYWVMLFLSLKLRLLTHSAIVYGPVNMPTYDCRVFIFYGALLSVLCGAARVNVEFAW